MSDSNGASALSAGRVTTSIQDGIASVTFFHPKGNSLPSALLGELAATVTRIGQDASVRVIVLRADGTGPFCAGASFDELRALETPDEGKRFFSGFAHVILAMRSAPQFVIARIHGKAVGGGVGLAAAADYAIATSRAHLRLSELAVGIGPFVVGPVIEKKIGSGHFSALSTDFDWRDAAWGARVGLYARVEETVEGLDAAVDAMARRIAAANPEAVAELKRIYWSGTEHWDSLLFERAAISGRLILTDAARAAIVALTA